jgi:hypothetical protein
VIACSFCRKSKDQVGKLIAGPGVYICNECVGLCDEILRSGMSNPQNLAAWEMTSDVGDVLATLPKVAAAGAQVEENLTGWVSRARQLGATWATIGEALGMTRQSAWERFSGEE